jgi:NADH-quinone oxidoreductase subunit E
LNKGGDFQLPDSIILKIESEADKYPIRKAAVKSALRYAQTEHGWISKDIIGAVAIILNLEPIEVFEVATFYDMFYTSPIGRHPIRVCTNVSCLLRGSTGIVNRLREDLAVDVGETSSDGRFTLLEAECLGACSGAPMMIVDDDYHEDLQPDQLDSILDSYQ